jgi:hypothetical protein
MQTTISGSRDLQLPAGRTCQDFIIEIMAPKSSFSNLMLSGSTMRHDELETTTVKS